MIWQSARHHRRFLVAALCLLAMLAIFPVATLPRIVVVEPLVLMNEEINEYHQRQEFPGMSQNQSPPLQPSLVPATTIKKGLITPNTTTNNSTAGTSDAMDWCKCMTSLCRAKCQRRIIGLHKMGFTVQLGVARKIFQKLVKTVEVTAHPRLGREFEQKVRHPKGTLNYRHVIVTRNIYASILSGYLYHRSGRECWLDFFGKTPSSSAFFQGWLLNNTQEDWHDRIVASSTSRGVYPWPDAQNRDLCRYLSEESESDGLRVYIEWAMAIYFRPFMDFVKERAAQGTTAGETMHICYEDQMRDFKSTSIKMANFFSYPLPNTTKFLDSAIQEIQGSGSGHGTETDSELRGRLKDIIAQLDRQLFNNTLAQWESQRDCAHDN